MRGSLVDVSSVKSGELDLNMETFQQVHDGDMCYYALDPPSLFLPHFSRVLPTTEGDTWRYFVKVTGINTLETGCCRVKEARGRYPPGIERSVHFCTLGKDSVTHTVRLLP